MNFNSSRKQLQRLKIIQYVVAVLWLITISIMIYQLVIGEPDLSIIISTMLLATSFIIISKYRSHQSKKLEDED